MGDGTPGFSGDGGAAANAQLRFPASVAVDRAGNLFIATDSRVRRVSPDGIITTVAGNGNSHPFCSTCGDGGPAVDADVSPAAVAVDAWDNLYIADAASFRIRKVSPLGIISTVAGRGRPNFNCFPNGDGARAVEQPSGSQKPDWRRAEIRCLLHGISGINHRPRQVRFLRWSAAPAVSKGPGPETPPGSCP